MKLWIAFWNILLKDMRTYYLKPPNISWGMFFPVAWTGMFFIKSGSGLGDLLTVLPGVVAVSILFGTTSLLAVTVTFEKRNRSFERLLLAPIPLELLMLAKTSGAILFGVTNAFVPVLLAALFAVALVSAAGAGVGCSHAMPPWLWIPFVMFVLVGGANAVNLTDGLDGLAAGLSCIAGLAMAVILALLQDYQMSLAAAAVAGAAAGFLWLNAHPARIFMGDIGSLGLGAALSAIAIAAGIEVLFAIIAAVFVWETLSVIIQVAYFKRTKGKRVFKMSPFHHHLELSGWAEPTVVIRLWLVGAVCALAAITIAFASVGTAGVRDLFR